MDPTTPDLIVIGITESFADVWSSLAQRLGLNLRTLREPSEVSGSGAAAVILACGGAEHEAIDWLQRAYRTGIDAPLIVGAEADHHLAVELMRRGAGAYFALPADLGRLENDLQQRAQSLAATDAGKRIEAVQRQSYDFGAIIGNDPGLHAALDRVARVVEKGRATVLITGETGTGKELVAQAVHYNSPRSRKPFVAVNCSAVPANLLESEFFGHEQGAFTDARAAKPGLFEVADGGTIFLDEISTLQLELQAKLLRVLETGEVRRVGGVRVTEVDVRIIAAANTNLESMVRAGQFREDLYYRLAVIPVHLPPLRERGADVLLLARHFLASLSEAYGAEAPVLSAKSQTLLQSHAWPGNVRELRNVIERGVLLSGDGPIEPEHLALTELAFSGAPHGSAGAPALAEESPIPFPASLKEIEIAAAVAAVEECEGNKTRAAEMLGIARARLYRLLGAAAEATATAAKTTEATPTEATEPEATEPEPPNVSQ